MALPHGRTERALLRQWRDGHAFAVRLAPPEQVIALRIVGQPACGDNPRQAFSSCAELQALAD
jgi:hypothetical protein